MITLNKIGDYHNRQVLEIECLKADEKPIGTIDGLVITNGSKLHELDGSTYEYDEQNKTWVLQPKSSGGADGREIELQKTQTHIQWRYVGTEEWFDLVSLDEISFKHSDFTPEQLQALKGAKGDKGNPGTNGTNGKDGLSIKSTQIDDSGHLILTFSDESTKDVGKVTGENGESAYQIAVRLGFHGTEQEWIESLKYNHSEEFTKLAEEVRSTASNIAAERQQITQSSEDITRLKEDIKELDKIKNYIEVDADEVVDGALINLDNKTLHNLHPNCYIKQIIPGNVKSIKVSGKSASAQWGFSLCGCYKEDGSLISKFGNDDNTVYTDLLIEIPNECAYVYINQGGNSAEKYKKIKFFTISNLTTDVENLKTNVSNLTTDVENLKKKINVDLNFNKIGYIEPNSKEPFYVVSNGDGFRTDYIPTEGYKKIKYDLKGDIRYIYLIAFFDENKKFLRDETQSIITKNADTISIPENAKYIVASTYSSSVVNGTASLINNNSLDEKITKLDSRITKIESIGIYGDSEFALFKKFGIVGDSLSVGHTVSKDGQTALGRNIYWSWGQYMARRLGNICLNFGRSGVTSKLWLNPSEQYCYPRLIDKANLCQAYIVALGANDTQAPLGSISDVNFTNMSLNADTEYGNYAKIIDTIQKTAPKAPIFLCTIPHPRNSDINIQAINNMIREFASESRFTGVYLVDLDAEYNEYYKTGKLGDEIRNTGWHLTSLGYLYDSFVRQRALSQVVADNCAEFQDVFLLPVGTNNELD